MKRFFEVYFVQWLRTAPKGPHHSLARWLLYIPSLFYGLISDTRSWLYDKGWLRSHPISIPVISVGNLVVGGGGKTPAILLLCDTLRGYEIAIASRGYRSAVEKLVEPVLLSKGQGPLHPAPLCGDEPMLLSNRVPEAIVCVGPNRLACGRIAEKHGAEVLLLDDGFQHRRLARDIDIVVIDAKEPFGLGYFLPRGFLRENPIALKRADLIVITYSPEPDERPDLEHQIRQFTHAPLVWTQLEVLSIQALDGGRISSIEGKSVGIFSGIAKPQAFRATIESLGASVVTELPLGDHRSPSPKEFERFQNQCLKDGAQYILCTEKDFVRGLPDHTESLPIAWVQSRFVIVEGNEHWEQMMLRFEDESAKADKYAPTMS